MCGFESKAVFVLGHIGCGAIKDAIDDVELGNLTGLLARIKPAIPRTKFEGERHTRWYEKAGLLAGRDTLPMLCNQVRQYAQDAGLRRSMR
jgi:carbonic anhydrase